MAAHAQPVLPGKHAWNDPNTPPPFVPERSPAIAFGYRRWPSSLLVLGFDTLGTIEPFQENEIYSAVRWFMSPERKNTLKQEESTPETAVKLLRWLFQPQNSRVRGWWRSSWSWRSPREFVGYRKIEEIHGIPHIEPFEVANMRLPDDISTDPDVVCFRAWCEGVQSRSLHPENPMAEGYSGAIREGLVKFCRSPWVAFALAAPLMQPTGVLFPNVGYIESCQRLEYLLRHPYEATDAELRYILASEMFKAGRRASTRGRRGGKVINPRGSWYVCGSIREALGPEFRKGAEWTAVRRTTSRKSR